MAREKTPPTVLDHVTVVLSPALIMGLVGALVFFLLEVLYRADGPFKPRMQWILGFYVFGIVLVGRVSMQGDGASRSTLYGLVLAVLTYIGMQSFVEYPPGVRPASFLVNLVLIAIVWWCSHRLVWDCTHVDEDEAGAAEGLLQAAGVEGKPPEDAPPEVDDQGRPLGWEERYKRWRDKQAKVLGVWVVYFSLAALPIFGLGQALVPLADVGRRQVTFWLMTVYVGCGLGLLLTTCFLGLRRYLRQRGASMPATTARAWIVTGAGLLGGLLLVGAMLPRPYSEYPWVTGRAGSPDRKADRQGQLDKGVKEKGGRGEEAKKDGHDGEKAGKDGEGKGKDAGEKGKDGKDAKGQGKDKGGDKAEKDGKDGQKGDGQQQPQSAPPLQWLANIAPWLKWMIFAVLSLIVGVVVVRQAIGFLANFTDWARRWRAWWDRLWADLFGGARSEASSDEQAPEADPDAPFAAFGNPFTTGRAEAMPPRELVRYAVAAFEAWARERGLARGGDETAQEFLGRVTEDYPALEAEGRRLVLLHARAEYGGGSLPASTADTVRAFWRQLERMAAAPQSA